MSIGADILRKRARIIAERYGVAPDLFERVIAVESGFDPGAVSPKGAIGIGQIMPATARDPGYGVTPLRNPSDPMENMRFAAEYLAAMQKRFGDPVRALVAYNWGPGNAAKWDGRMETLPAETRNYVRRILGEDERVAQNEPVGVPAEARLEPVEDPDLIRRLETGEGTSAQLEPVEDPALLRILEGGDQTPDVQPAQAQDGQKDEPSFMQRLGAAAATMVNDINAGFQGVNPVSLSKAMPLGFVVRHGDDVYLDVDGSLTRIPPEKYGEFVTAVDPATGKELLYRRTPEMEESALASAGRVLGYGILNPVTTSRAVTAASRPQAQAMQAAKELGVTPSLGMTGPVGARVAGAMESFYPTAGRVADDAGRAMREAREAVGRAAGKVGPGSTPLEAGSALERGAEAFMKAHLIGGEVPSLSQRLFARVSRYIPPDTRIDVSEVADTLKSFISRFQDTPEIARSLGQSRWQKWLQDIEANNGMLTWEQVSQLRTMVGESIGKIAGPMADTAGGELKQVYAALTRDLEKAAEAAGPRAAEAWKRAVSHYRWATGRMQEALDLIFKAKSPEAAYEAFLALGRESGSRANLRRLADIKRAMPAEAWREVVATVIRRMGAATPGAQSATGDTFSASKFLTDWNRLSPEAKNLLFSGKGVPDGLHKELDALAKMMEAAKAAERQINVSRSGTVLGNLSLAGAATVSPVKTIALAIGAHLTARMLTSPPVLRALRNYIASGGSRGAAERLIKAAGRNPELIADVNRLIRLTAPETSQPRSRPRLEEELAPLAP